MFLVLLCTIHYGIITCSTSVFTFLFSWHHEPIFTIPPSTWLHRVCNSHFSSFFYSEIYQITEMNWVRNSISCWLKEKTCAFTLEWRNNLIFQYLFSVTSYRLHANLFYKKKKKLKKWLTQLAMGSGWSIAVSNHCHIVLDCAWLTLLKHGKTLLPLLRLSQVAQVSNSVLIKSSNIISIKC